MKYVSPNFVEIAFGMPIKPDYSQLLRTILVIFQLLQTPMHVQPIRECVIQVGILYSFEHESKARKIDVALALVWHALSCGIDQF